MTWNRPYHLSDAEAQQWVRTEVHRLATIPDVQSVSLSQPANTRRHRPPHDWICELELHNGASGDALLEHPVCAEWLGDLRTLGMRPNVAILETTEAVTAEAADRPEIVTGGSPQRRAPTTRA